MTQLLQDLNDRQELLQQAKGALKQMLTPDPDTEHLQALPLTHWLDLLACPGLPLSYAALGLRHGWAADDLAAAWRLQCPAWTLPLAALQARQTHQPVLACAWQLRGQAAPDRDA